MSARFEAKVMGLDALREAVEQGRLARPLVFTNGVFDICTVGMSAIWTRPPNWVPR